MNATQRARLTFNDLPMIGTQVGNGRPRFLLTQMPQWGVASD
jgi:hypothetical protein